MNLVRDALTIFLKLKYSMLVAAMICAPIMTIYQSPLIPNGSLVGLLIHNFTGFATAGFFGGLCSLLVLMWKPKYKLLSLVACFWIPFIAYGIENHIVPIDTDIFMQMLKAPLIETPGYLKYLVESLWSLCLPGFIGGAVVTFSSKQPEKHDSIRHLGHLPDSQQVLNLHEKVIQK